MATVTPLINGTAYSWSSVTVNVLGVQVVGITSISYSEEQEIESNFGAGNRPVSVGYGQIVSEGSVTLHHEEVARLEAVAPNGRLQEIPPFDIVVNFEQGGRVQNHKLRNCIFTTNQRELNQNDKMFEVELPLYISHIEWR